MGFVAATAAYAHFVFVIPDEAGSKVNVIINEELKPSLEVGVGIIEGTKLSLRDAAGAETPLALVKEEHTLTGDLPGEKTGTRLIHGLTDLGESTRGSTKPYRLLYHPKTILGDAFDAKAVVGGDVPVEIVPRGGPGAMTLELVGRGKPVADAEITVILPDGKQQKVKTGRDGRTPVLTQTGRYGAWARFWETDVATTRLWSSTLPMRCRMRRRVSAPWRAMGGCTSTAATWRRPTTITRKQFRAALTACVSLEIRCGRPFQAARQVKV